AALELQLRIAAARGDLLLVAPDLRDLFLRVGRALGEEAVEYTRRERGRSRARCRSRNTGRGPLRAPRCTRPRARAERAAGARPGGSCAWGESCCRTRSRSAAGSSTAGGSRRRS